MTPRDAAKRGLAIIKQAISRSKLKATFDLRRVVVTPLDADGRPTGKPVIFEGDDG